MVDGDEDCFGAGDPKPDHPYAERTCPSGPNRVDCDRDQPAVSAERLDRKWGLLPARFSTLAIGDWWHRKEIWA
jgi:hypothetical protein